MGSFTLKFNMFARTMRATARKFCNKQEISEYLGNQT